MDGTPNPQGVRPARSRLHGLYAAWLGLAFSTLTCAQGTSPFAGLRLPSLETMLVLGAGIGVLLVAAAVLGLAVRELRRDAAARRRIYMYRRRGRDRIDRPPATTD